MPRHVVTQALADFIAAPAQERRRTLLFTMRMTVVERAALELAAIRAGTTAATLIRRWIENEQAREKKA